MEAKNSCGENTCIIKSVIDGTQNFPSKKILGQKILVHGSIVLEYKFLLGPIKFHTQKKQVMSLMEAKKSIVLEGKIKCYTRYIFLLDQSNLSKYIFFSF